MLRDMIRDLRAAVESKNEKEIEAAYKRLEKIGMDRTSSNIVLEELIKEEPNGDTE